jgi:hypothetical protein
MFSAHWGGGMKFDNLVSLSACKCPTEALDNVHG